MHPGHPLMLAMTDMLLEQHTNLLRQGAILIDPADEGTDPALLFLLTHEIKSGDDRVLSKRLQFVRVGPDGEAEFAGWAPHLDPEPLPEAERMLLAPTLAAPWISSGQEGRALALAAQTLVPDHYNEVAHRRVAMDAVRQTEEGRGCRVVDVSADKCGWDLSAYPPEVDGKQPEPRHIEVKGRIKGASTVTVTKNEMLYAFNQGDKFVLAIVLVNGDDSCEGPYYLCNPFENEPGWGVASINFNLGELLAGLCGAIMTFAMG
jgi:hypothetical protein